MNIMVKWKQLYWGDVVLKDPKKLLSKAKSTVVQCDFCNLYIVSPLDNLPDTCPDCRSEGEFSIVSISYMDSIKLYEYIME